VVERALRPLAEAMGCDVSTARDPMPFQDLRVDVLGLARVRDRADTEFPDIFVDAAERVFGARPELTINRLAMDPTGRIWPEAAVQDLYLRRARLTAAPLGVQLRQVLRILNTCTDVGLELVPEAAAVLQEHVERLRNAEQFRREACDQFVESQVRRMLTGPSGKGAGPKPGSAGHLRETLMDLLRKERPESYTLGHLGRDAGRAPR